MKKLLTVYIFLFLFVTGFSQASDYIIIKKHNSRTLKTYSPGGFLSAETYDGFLINGYIKAIQNDSIILLQQDTRLMATEFGTKVDTFAYTMGINYRLIKKFNFGSSEIRFKKHGFSAVTIPRLMMIGGIGFIGLELINTAYRREPLNDSKKLSSLGIAAGVTGAGWLYTFISQKRNKVGGKYKVVYVKAGSLDNRPK